MNPRRHGAPVLGGRAVAKWWCRMRPGVTADNMGKPTLAVIEARVRGLIARFEEYLASFDRDPPFTDEQLSHHLETCTLRAEIGNVARAAVNERFLKSLYETLRSWRMQMRGARLVPWAKFRDAFERSAADIASLEGCRLDAPDLEATDAANRVWRLMEKLAISENVSRLVSGTKALHHLLPELVVPIDRAYTGALFGWNNYDWQTAQRKTLRFAFEVFSRVARETRARNYVGDRWRSSYTKLIDNAVVGFCRRHLLDEGSHRRALEAKARELGIWEEVETEARRRAEEILLRRRTSHP